MPVRALILATLLATAVLIPALHMVPRAFPPDPTLPNVAAMSGYNVSLAWLVIFGWAALIIALTALLLPTRSTPPDIGAEGVPPSGLRRWGERIIVALPALVIYWPAAVARFGPHVEDAYFVAVLQRMSCGQVLYRDFEFLYGPLMIAAPGMLAGEVFSPIAYYSVYAAFQALFLVIIMGFLQHLIPETRRRWLAFLVFLPFWFDVLLGLNWIGWRYLAGLVTIFLLSRTPRSPRIVVLCGVILGLGAGYSHEYALAGLVSALAILALDGWRSVLVMLGRMAGLVGVALATWFASVFWVLGDDIGAYLELSKMVMSRASAEGLGQFAFGWSLHTLVLFALLAAACVATGTGLRHVRGTAAREGDLLLLGAGVYAVVTLKIALQRADYLHMALPFVPLILIWLAARPAQLFPLPRALRRFGVVLIVLAALSQTIGHLPIGRWAVQSNLRGLYHEVTGRAQVGKIEARGPSTHTHRTRAQEDKVMLAARLAAPELSQRPVLFYGGSWGLAPETGVCPIGYSFYDILYSDDLQPLTGTLHTEGVIVVMQRKDYEGLEQGGPAPRRPSTGLSRMVGWVSGDSSAQSALENGIERKMWKEAAGEDILRDFILFEEVGPYLLFERKS